MVKPFEVERHRTGAEYQAGDASRRNIVGHNVGTRPEGSASGDAGWSGGRQRKAKRYEGCRTAYRCDVPITSQHLLSSFLTKPDFF